MQDALARDDERSRAQRHLVVLRHLPHSRKGVLHDAYQARVDLVFRPEKAGKVLHPFKVAHRHATSVGNHIGQHQHALVVEDVISLRGGRAVGTFNHHLGLDTVGVVFGDLTLQRCRNQDVTGHAPKIRVVHRLSTGKASHATVLAHMLKQRWHVHTCGVVEGSRVVLHCHHLGTCLGKQLASRAAHVAKTLYRNAGIVNGHARKPRGLHPHREHATARGLHTTERATNVHRFARDHTGRSGAGVHGIGIHHPGHDLAVGVHVGGRNVFAGANDDADLAGVAARQALQFCLRQGLGIDPNTPLGPAVGHVHRSVFDGHPGGQRHHLRQRDILVVAHATLARATAQVVLHTITLEVGDGAVVQLNRHIHDQGALGALERFHPARQTTQIGRDALHLLQISAPGAEVVRIKVGRQGMRRHGSSRGKIKAYAWLARLSKSAVLAWYARRA